MRAKFLRLVVAEPEDLGRREAGERGVGDHLDELLAAAGAALDLVALGGGALVVPEQGGADHLAGFVEEHRAVHLAGEADGGDVGGLELGLLHDGADDLHRGLPPVLGVLLAPQRLGVGARVAGAGRGEDAAVGGDGEALGSGGADVDAETGGHGEGLRLEAWRLETGDWTRREQACAGVRV